MNSKNIAVLACEALAAATLIEAPAGGCQVASSRREAQSTSRTLLPVTCGSESSNNNEWLTGRNIE